MGKKGNHESAYSCPKDVYEMASKIVRKQGTTINKVIKEHLLNYCVHNKHLLTEVAPQTKEK